MGPGLSIGGAIPVRNVRAAVIRPLSKRQLEIVRMLADGLSDRQIARALRPRCSVATVRWHIREAANVVPGKDVRRPSPSARLIFWYRGASRELLVGG